MAHFIADRLNYDDTDVFVTPFGGMCRVLLNKPRHSLECYNDFSSGLTALMQILSNPDRAAELIHRLEDETDHSQETFDKQKAIFDNAETDLEKQEKEKLRRLLIDNGIVESYTAQKFITEILGDSLSDNSVKEKDNSDKGYIKDSYAKLKEKLESDSDFREVFEKLLANWIQLYQQKESEDVIERPADRGEWVSDMDLAIATYVVFQQSRDGMGKV